VLSVQRVADRLMSPCESNAILPIRFLIHRLRSRRLSSLVSRSFFVTTSVYAASQARSFVSTIVKSILRAKCALIAQAKKTSNAVRLLAQALSPSAVASFAVLSNSLGSARFPNGHSKSHGRKRPTIVPSLRHICPERSPKREPHPTAPRNL
jgi:hypothetical protein